MEHILSTSATDNLLLVGFGAFFVLLLVVLAMTDLRTGRLPNWQNALLFVGGVPFCYSAYGHGPGSALLAASLGGALLLAVSSAYRGLRKRDGLGGGDIKFVAACGPWVGTLGMAPMIFLAAVAGLSFVLGATLAGRSMAMNSEIRFGPFLAAGAFMVWIVDVAYVASGYASM